MFTTGFGDGMYPSFWGQIKTENLLAL
ncbi:MULTISPECIES: DUF4241 domain-containing protein [Bacillus]